MPRTRKTYAEQLEANENEIQKHVNKIGELKEQKKDIIRRQKAAERNARTKHLVEIGAVAESVLGRKFEEGDKEQKLAKDKKVFRSLVEKSAMNLYKKERGKLHAEYLARKLLLSGYVAWITFLLLSVSVLSAIRQKVFWGDLTVFLETLKHGILIPADRIDHFSRQTADITKGIEQPIVSSVLWWIVRVGIPLSAIMLTIFFLAILIRRYGRDLWEKGINRWNSSLSIMILYLFVFCGDYVKVILRLNLVLIWLILDTALIGIAWYRYTCDECRGEKIE